MAAPCEQQQVERLGVGRAVREGLLEEVMGNLVLRDECREQTGRVGATFQEGGP